ncbi:MAG: tripartite tricarboxylate transporter substrate binding protein [Usitatibacteraceae bacterium]
MRLRRQWLLLIALAVAIAGPVVGFDARAQAWPEKAVRIIVPFPPGGGADTLARVMAPKLSQMWGQPVLIENRPGAAGMIGADAAAQSPADGLTLLMSSTASLTEKNVAQFAPVSLVSASAYVIVVNADVKANNVRELIALARQSPGKLAFGSSGTGAASHLAGELFKSMAHVDLLHVPYKGTGQALTDLLGGQVQLMFAPPPTVLPHVQSGKLRSLAVTSEKRSLAMPQIPTVAEAGLPGYAAIGWFGLLSPVATPKTLVSRISIDANKVLQMKDVHDRLLALGSEPEGNTPEQFAAFIRHDMEKWARLIKELGIKPE